MKNRILEVLAIKPFFFLFLAEIFSQIAVNMLNFILVIVAFKLVHSTAASAAIVLSFTIPAILFGVVAGVCVDRWNKKTVLFTTNIIRGALLLILASFHRDFLGIAALSFLISIVTQFFIPAESPVIPLIVPKKLLLSANALFGMGIFTSVVIGYAISGPFLLFFGESSVFIVLALFFAVASVFVSFIKIPKRDILKKEIIANRLPLTLKDELKGAFSLMTKTRRIYHSFFLLGLSQLIIMIFAVIGPGYANEILGIDVDAFPLVLATPAALGVMVGSIVVGNFLHSYPKHKSASLGVLLSGIAIFLLPYGSKVASREFIHTINMYLPNIFTINILHIMVFLVFILGLANAFIFIPSNTILQEETAEAFRGKIYGALNALIGLFSLLPVIIVGGLADLFGVGKVITGIGMSVMAVGIIRLVFLKKH